MLILFLSALFLGGYAQSCPEPGVFSPNDPYCAADLTIAIDYTPAMQSSTNVYNELKFIVQEFTNKLPISVQYVNTAILGYGLQGLKASDLFVNYANVCSEIDSECDSYSKDQGSPYSIANLFKYYQAFMYLYRRPPIPTKFVVFTATNDLQDIQAAIPFAQNISKVADIIIVGINQSNPAYLRQLSNTTYFLSGFNGFDNNLTKFLLDNICTFDLTTPGPSTTKAVGNPASNVIGTPCANDPPRTWLDIYVAIDHSTSMGSGVAAVASALQGVFYNMTIGQNLNTHFSRVAIYLFNSKVTVFANITTYDSTTALINGLTQLAHTSPTDVDELNLENVIQRMYNDSLKNTRNARQVMLIFASTYDRSGNDNPAQIAASFKDMGGVIIGVDYHSATNIPNKLLQNITSPGMFFKSDADQGDSLGDNILLAFANANCMCPTYHHQFIVYNSTYNVATYYADCLMGTITGAFALFAENSCEGSNGTLAAVTSPQKEAFILQTVVPQDLPGNTHFHIGLHRVDNQLVWYNYPNQPYPLGNFSNWAPGSGPNGGGNCTFYDNYQGSNWGWTNEPCLGYNTFSYVCQLSACDADSDCDVDAWMNIGTFVEKS